MRRLAPALAAALACSAPPAIEDGGDPPALALCMGGAFTPAPAEGFRHLASQLVAALGEPGHSMQDVIAAEGAAIAVHGKFAYGPMSNDLEDERVRVFVHGCSGFQSLGDATTDGDGRIAFPVPALPVGVYDVRLEVLGDESTAAGRVWVLPRGTHIAVSDVDGTLTTSDGELVQDVLTDFFGPIFSGDDIPSAYPGAADLTRALADRGYVLLYLTGRPYWLTGKTRAWLADGGFALGALHTTDSNGEALPVDTGVGAFKLAFLEALAAQGLLVDEAYGNATTDVYAYAGAGIPAASTWIIGPNAGLGGTNAVTGSWAARAAEVQALPPIAQPFVH